MTATPNINRALQDTAQDLRHLGQAAKTDLQRLQHDAQNLAQTRVIEPGTRFVREASHQIEEQARHTVGLAKDKFDDVCDYVAENPGRALLGAIAGGILLGFIFRR